MTQQTDWKGESCHNPDHKRQTRSWRVYPKTINAFQGARATVMDGPFVRAHVYGDDVKSTLQHAHLISAAPDLLAACEALALRIYDHNESFEGLAAAFYATTGFLAPGKDDPLPQDRAAREMAWALFVQNHNVALEKQARAAIARAKKEIADR